MIKLNVSWMSNPQYLAQVGHFFGAACLLFTVRLFSASKASLLWTLLIGLLIAGLKEFVFDTSSWGEGDSFAHSAMDFSFYLLGGLVSFVLIYLKGIK